jgi:glycerophosphoryl diester phosphodiesterase
MDFELVLVGGETTGVSYDNLTVNSAGQVILQEDRAGAGGLILTTQRRYARVLAFTPDSSTVSFLFEANQAGIDPGSALDYGNWETSGIIEIGVEPKTGKSIYLLTVQAHSLSDPDYVQGGQLVLLIPITDQSYLPSTYLP